MTWDPIDYDNITLMRVLYANIWNPGNKFEFLVVILADRHWFSADWIVYNFRSCESSPSNSRVWWMVTIHAGNRPCLDKGFLKLRESLNRIKSKNLSQILTLKIYFLATPPTRIAGINGSNLVRYFLLKILVIDLPSLGLTKII